MKIFRLYFVILFFLFLNVFVSAKTLSGGVLFTVEAARQVAFSDIAISIDIMKHNAYFLDKNYKENTVSTKTNKNKFKDRNITIFSDNTYAISYRSKPEIYYYYNKFGELILIDIEINNEYPYLTARYDILGNLDSTTLTVSKRNSFIFDKNKKLIAHWIGNNCYDEKGELITTRDRLHGNLKESKNITNE